MINSGYGHGFRFMKIVSFTSRKLIHSGPFTWNNVKNLKEIRSGYGYSTISDEILKEREIERKSLYRLLTRNGGEGELEGELEGESGGELGVNKMNASDTLPQFQLLLTKEKIEELYEIELNNKKVIELKKKMIINYRFFKNYLNFFKSGILNIWKNYRLLSKTIYGNGNKEKFIYSNSLNVSDRIFEIKKMKVTRSGINNIIDEMANVIRLTENEFKAKKSNIWIEQEKETESDNKLIHLTRSEFQRMIRDKENFIKLPLFALLFGLIEEGTILICLLFPNITPNTCVFPRLMPVVYDKAFQAQLKLQLLIRYEEKYKDIMMKNPFLMNYDELKWVCDLLQVNYGIKVNKETLREKLMTRYKEILIDNYLIVRDGGINQLNEVELFEACIRRGMIDYEILIGQEKYQDGLFLKEEELKKMRKELIEFIIKFNGQETSVGLLGAKITSKY